MELAGGSNVEMKREDAVINFKKLRRDWQVFFFQSGANIQVFSNENIFPYHIQINLFEMNVFSFSSETEYIICHT